MVKKLVKKLFLGKPGLRPRDIRRGLLRGLRFLVDTSYKSLRLLGLDESELTKPIRRFAAQAATACDIGANDGWYTVYFAAQPNIVRVYAFEPDESVIPLIRQNLELNDPTMVSKVTIDTRFVGDHEGQTSCTIDAMADSLAQPVLMKIDVEGGELAVLQGARRILGSGRCFLVVETHSELMEQACLKFLGELGYQCQIVRNAWYRIFVPEARVSEHNRWLLAAKPTTPAE